MVKSCHQKLGWWKTCWKISLTHHQTRLLLESLKDWRLEEDQPKFSKSEQTPLRKFDRKIDCLQSCLQQNRHTVLNAYKKVELEKIEKIQNGRFWYQIFISET